MTALQPAFDGAGADEQAAGAEVLVAHPGGVGLEVAQGGVQFFGFGPGEREGAGG